jgi:uroporphyrinogen decarboxylase
MLDVDLPRFWRDDEQAHRDPFSRQIPQVPLGIRMSYETLFSELGYPLDLRRLDTDYDFARSAARAYNDLAERIVGRRLLDEAQYDPAKRFPAVKSVGELFGCRSVWEGWSWWLMPAAGTPAELEAVLARVEKLDVRAAMFPPDWAARCRQIHETHGLRPRLGRALRGPVTLAMSIYGVENLIYLIVDQPDLAARFRDVLLKVVLAYYRTCDEVSGTERGPDGRPVRGGFWFADDNCAMLTAEMYAFFGQPILKAVFDEFASRPGDPRYQHSDSDMGHLLPLLAQTGLTRVNFGPNVRFRDIRAAMPRAVVEGTLAPFTFMGNDEAAIIGEVRRDLDEARESLGLVVATAGSINDGSKLTSMRAVMHAIQYYGRVAEG